MRSYCEKGRLQETGSDLPETNPSGSASVAQVYVWQTDRCDDMVDIVNDAVVEFGFSNEVAIGKFYHGPRSFI